MRAGRVWVNDPQQIVREPPSWWWNPLDFVSTVERAEKLVESHVLGSIAGSIARKGTDEVGSPAVVMVVPSLKGWASDGSAAIVARTGRRIGM